MRGSKRTPSPIALSIPRGQPVTIMRSTFANNSAALNGGGLYIPPMGRVSITNSTFNGNSAEQGGAISSSGTLSFNNVTIAGNSASNYGGGISVGAGVTIQNTIIANNMAGMGSLDCYMNNNVTMTSYGHNIVRDVSFCNFSNVTPNGAGLDPMLAPLADNGGPTKTMALLPGSAAIASGNPNVPGSAPDTCAVTDQRGVPRGSIKDGTICSIGAYDEAGHGPADLAVPPDLRMGADLSAPADISAVQDLSPDDLAMPSDLSATLPATNSCGCSVGHVANDKPAALFIAFVVVAVRV
jgi:predicted outer membrane repeat protein